MFADDRAGTRSLDAVELVLEDGPFAGSGHVGGSTRKNIAVDGGLSCCIPSTFPFRVIGNGRGRTGCEKRGTRTT